MNEKQEQQINMSQGFADQIEHLLRNIFRCERYGFGGQINSDNIRKHPFLSMTQGLAYLYANSAEKRNAIDEFIIKFYCYEDMSIDKLLSCDKNFYKEGIMTKELEKKDGVEELKYIIEEFTRVIK